ncbi:hypothetical protein [Roseibium sp.]|uniref:hypothetical protein n=1 Tax=Roseibium sp. TaxID=1936156 RepID=UPI003A980E22
MTDAPGFPLPFDLGAVARDMQQRFGWTEGDLGAAMAQLMPAAMSGVRHFGASLPEFKPFLMPGMNAAPFWGAQAATFGDDHLSAFFGPSFIRKAVTQQIAAVTGLQQEAIAEMMPVAATLAMGQLARPYLQGEARELLDAFMRGYARGRPKPVPGPADYINGYTQAMQAFWSGFLRPPTAGDVEETEEAEELPEEEVVSQEESEAIPERAPASELEGMVADWMTAGRDFQSSQFKAFDSFFERAVRDLGKGTPPAS